MAAVYNRKRERCSSATSETAVQSKHKIGYNASWKTDFPWHIPVFDDTVTNIISLLCSTCKQHGATQRNSSGTWTDKLCTSLRRDALQRHKESEMQKASQEREATRLASERDGGVRQAFSNRVMIQRKAVIGALQPIQSNLIR